MTTSLITAHEEAVEAALEGCGWPWTRRDKSWAVPANAWLPREIQVRCDGLGATVESRLVEGEDASAEAVAALKQFLERAQMSLRHVHGEVEGSAARVVSRVELDRIDAGLTPAIHAVGVAVRRLHRDAAALLNAEAARAYLAFHLEKS